MKKYDRLIEGSCLIYFFRVTGANSPGAPSDFYRPIKGYRLIQTALLGDRYTAVNPTAEYLKSSDLVAQSVGTVVWVIYYPNSSKVLPGPTSNAIATLYEASDGRPQSWPGHFV